MKLIQILLPLQTSEGKPIGVEVFHQMRKELAEQFGGVTAYTRSPATGLWKNERDQTVKDHIITFEIMTGEINKEWWKHYKEKLEIKFKQDEIVVRTWEMDLI